MYLEGLKFGKSLIFMVGEFNLVNWWQSFSMRIVNKNSVFNFVNWSKSPKSIKSASKLPAIQYMD